MRSLLFYCCAISGVAWIFFPNLSLQITLLGAASGCLLFSIEINKINFSNYKAVFILIGGVIASQFLRVFVLGSQVSLSLLLSIFGVFGATLFLLRRRIHKTPIYVIFWLLVSFYAFLLINQINPNEIFDSSSRNTNSWIMIYITSLICIIRHKQNQSIDVLPSFLTWLISIWSVGRSGITSSTILLIGCVVLSTVEQSKTHIKFTSKRNIIKAACLTIILCLSASIIFTFDFSNTLDGLEQKYNQGFDDQYRGAMNYHYLQQLGDIKTFLFGYDLFKDDIFMRFDGNPHNSWIILHSNFGIFSFAIFFGLIYCLLSFLKKNKLYALILGVIMLRVSSDGLLFYFRFSDFLIYYFLCVNFIPSSKLKNISSKLRVLSGTETS